MSINYFSIEELVPKALFEKYQHAHHILWGLFNRKALLSLIALRARFGSLTVNDWSWGGSNQYRGFRPGDCPIGAGLSQHKLGNAFDCNFKDHTAEEVRQYILANPEEFPYITTLEMGVSWLHFDCRYIPSWNGVIKQFWPRGNK